MSQAWGFLAASSEALLAAFLQSSQHRLFLFLHSVGVRDSRFICHPSASSPYITIER